MSNALLTWWQAATPEQKQDLAAATGSTVPSLHQMAHSYRTAGGLNLTAGMAVKIDQALKGAVSRKVMSPACAACEFSRCYDGA